MELREKGGDEDVSHLLELFIARDSARYRGRALKSFVVTGASTGIGRATVLRLDRAGHRVLASVRREEDAADLRKAASDRLEPVIMDITDAASIAA